MFKLAIRMFRSDLRREVKGCVGMTFLCWILIFFLVITPLIPVEASTVFIFHYGTIVTMVVFFPRIVRWYYVIPFTIEQIRKLVVYRMLVVLLFMVVGSGICIGWAEYFGYPWNPRFGLWYFVYVELGLRRLAEGLKGFYAEQHKNLCWRVFNTILLVVNVNLALGVSEELLPIWVQYLIMIIVTALSLPYYIYYVFRKMDFYDYCQINVMGKTMFLDS